MLKLVTVLVTTLGAAACLRPGLPRATTDFSAPVAGSSEDSAALAHAIGMDLPSELVRQVVSRFVCPVHESGCVQFPGWSYRWSAHDDPFLEALAAAAEVQVGPPSAVGGLLCPDGSSGSPNAGYLAVLSRPILRGDTATVTVRFTCRYEARGSERGFMRDLEYTLRREMRAWRIVAKPLTRIT